MVLVLVLVAARAGQRDRPGPECNTLSSKPPLLQGLFDLSEDEGGEILPGSLQGLVGLEAEGARGDRTCYGPTLPN